MGAYKTKEQIERIALEKLRNSKNKKLLNNTNVDCFIMGYDQAENDIYSLLSNTDRREFIDQLDRINEYYKQSLEKDEEDLGYSGYMYTIPKSREETWKQWEQIREACNLIKKHIYNIPSWVFGEFYKEKIQNKETINDADS